MNNRARLVRTDSERRWMFTESIALVWTDPPFGTNKPQIRGSHRYDDVGPHEAALMTVAAIENMKPSFTDSAVVCVCADDRIIHDVTHSLEWELGLHHQGDVIWTFGLGRPRTNWWPRRHNTIATFTMYEALPDFDKSAIPREIRKAPKPGYEGDKVAGSVWDYTMSNTDPERVGYPNQKPLAIIEPFVLAHTRPGDIVADPFMGSGSTGVAALKHKRKFRGQDANPKAMTVARQRLGIG